MSRQPLIQEIACFTAAVYEPEDIVEVRILPTGVSTWHAATKLPAEIAYLQHENAQERNIYAGANPRRQSGGTKDTDVLIARCAFADFDDTADVEVIRFRITSANLPPPTLTLCSGRGIHVYWRFSQAVEDLDGWRALQVELATRLGSDSKVQNPSRIMRLPGFKNYNRTKHPPVADAWLIESELSRRYDFDFLFDQLRIESCYRENGENREIRENRGNIRSIQSGEKSHGIVYQASPDVENQVARAITDTCPTAPGERHRRIFDFARRLKAIPGLSDAPVRELRDFVVKWHAAALPFIRTKPFEETWLDFANAWERVRFPAGEEPMALILERADRAELTPIALGYDSPETRRLVMLCRELQRASGSNPFFLSCRTAGGLLGLDHMTAWRRLQVLLVDGIIEETSRGTKTKAARYRYIRDDL